MSDTSFRIEEGDFSSPFFLSDTPHYPYLLPNGWEWCNLEDIVCELKYGTSEKSLSVGKIAVLRMGNITNVGTIDYSNLVYSSNNEDIKLYSLEKDDLLFNRTNSSEWVGKTAIYKKEQPAIYAGYLIRIRPILIFSDYLNTVMNSSYYRNWCYNVKTDAVNQSNINAQKLSQLMIPIPPLKEQERIVVEVAKWISLIDTIKNSKEDLQTTIKQAKSKILNLAIHGKLVPQDPNDEPAIELLKRINPDFTPCDNGHYTFKIPNSWTWCKLGDIAQSNIGLTYKPTDITDNGIPVYRSNNIRDRKIDKSDLVRVNAPILEKQFLNIGDLLICARNGSRRLVGKCAIIEELDEVTSFGAFMAVCRSEYNQWIFNLLNTTYFDRYLDDSNSTAINQVTQRMLLALHIPLPPLSEQQRIVQKIEELFSVLDNIQNALEV